MGGDYLAFCLALHELARVDSSVAITLEAAVALGAMPIFRFGSRRAARGMAAAAVPGGAAGRVRADRAGRRVRHPRRHADHGPAGAGRRREWVIDGSKAFITNSGTSITSVVTVLAITGRAGSRPEISSIMVPAGTPGFTVSREYSKVGWCASDTRELAFSGCRVPEGNLLGERRPRLRPVPRHPG